MRTKQLLQILLCGYLLSCNSDDNQSTLSIGIGKDVTVSLNILDPKGITKIEFISNGDNHSVTANELAKYRTIDYGLNGKGEGTFKVFVHTNIDTFQSEYYVEGGYHVKLECDSSHIKTIDPTGY
ncbi:MAG: hypothetical protein KA736_05570 [Crocinitomicaceae bacterium]|nr:hypothetical protein [Crocinitomicaceae bacterium]MBP6031983.1 hypothetical protein [Crocinitomicaceae bacterium]